MPARRQTFVRSTVLYLGLGAAVLLAIVTASAWLTADLSRTFSDVVAARETRSRSADLLSLVQDAETGQRGFLITADSRFLEPYTAALAQFDAKLGALQVAIGRTPDLAPTFEHLGQVLRRKLDEMRQTVELARDGEVERARDLVREGEGRMLMDQARADFSSILSRSEASVRESMAAQRRATDLLARVIQFGSLAILAMGAAAGWTILRYTGEIIAARQELEGLNVGLEERVNERTDALRKANEEIQRFAYIVTHDLRAPLVNIMGFTSELETTLKPIAAYVEAEPPAEASLREEARLAATEDLPEAIGFIRSSTRKMDGLINAILKISREGSRTLKAERIELPKLLEQAASAVHHQASSDGGDGIEVDAKVPVIVSDRLSLDQILGNLLDNAVKYRMPGRPLRIALRARRERTGRVSIEVEDNGRGIPQADQERVFELFRRSGAQTTPGEGIGLAHVRTLARALGGDVTVRSQPGEGSTFTITLPPDLRAVQRSATP